MSTKSQMFRDLLARPEGLFAFGVARAIDAKVAEMAGSECIYAGGYSAAGANGWPDMGIMTMAEILSNLRRICKSTNLPVVADIDDGYGGVVNVERTTEEFFETTDAAGFHIEDQNFPKRCGHIAGKEVLSLDEFVGKLRLMIDIRDRIDPSRFIIARTDAFSAVGGNKHELYGGDLDEAVKRGIAYADAGADSVWCEFPTPSRITAREFAYGIQMVHPKLPLSFNYSVSLAWHKEQDPMTFDELVDYGYKFIFCTYPALLVSAAVVYQTAEHFKHRGGLALVDIQKRLAGCPIEKMMEVLGVGRYQDLEKRYSPKAKINILGSEGFKQG